jgi:hypothetical protein
VEGSLLVVATREVGWWTPTVPLGKAAAELAEGEEVVV